MSERSTTIPLSPCPDLYIDGASIESIHDLFWHDTFGDAFYWAQKQAVEVTYYLLAYPRILSTAGFHTEHKNTKGRYESLTDSIKTILSVPIDKDHDEKLFHAKQSSIQLTNSWVAENHDKVINHLSISLADQQNYLRWWNLHKTERAVFHYERFDSLTDKVFVEEARSVCTDSKFNGGLSQKAFNSAVAVLSERDRLVDYVASKSPLDDEISTVFATSSLVRGIFQEHLRHQMGWHHKFHDSKIPVLVTPRVNQEIATVGSTAGWYLASYIIDTCMGLEKSERISEWGRMITNFRKILEREKSLDSLQESDNPIESATTILMKIDPLGRAKKEKVVDSVIVVAGVALGLGLSVIAPKGYQLQWALIQTIAGSVAKVHGFIPALAQSVVGAEQKYRSLVNSEPMLLLLVNNTNLSQVKNE